MTHKILLPKVDAALYARLKEAAQAEHRTVSNFVYVFLLRRFAEPREKEQGSPQAEN